MNENTKEVIKAVSGCILSCLILSVLLFLLYITSATALDTIDVTI